MITPTAADVRAWSNVNFDWAELGYEEGTPDPLAKPVEWALGWLQTVTGQQFDSTMTDVNLVAMAEQATLLKTQQIAFEQQQDFQETATDDVVASFSAGSYSETHVDPIKRSMVRTLNQNPALARLLWGLMTPGMVDYWTALLTGKDVPASATAEIDWGEWYGPYEPVPGAWGAPGYWEGLP